MNRITTEEVVTDLNGMKSSAIANMGISPRTLKDSANVISTILTSIFNKVMETLIFQQLWMECSVFFLHKKDDRKEPNNYWSICIQKAFLKVFGKILNSRITNFNETYKIIPDNQFGFRPGLSSCGATTILRELITDILNQKKISLVKDACGGVLAIPPCS